MCANCHADLHFSHLYEQDNLEEENVQILGDKSEI